MTGFSDPAYFGELWADDYDTWNQPDPAAAVEFLTELAGDRRVLELASGTGRVTVPLAAQGVMVEGIEGSASMVEQMRAKPGGEHIPVAIGDMADVSATGPFGLVFLVHNTMFNLLGREQQARCFRNAARVLDTDGAFVVEAYIPNPAWLDQNPVQVLEVTDISATIEVYKHDAANQSFRSQKITFDNQGMRLRPHAERYSWPNELDLMAELADLRLDARYTGWDRQPFSSHSTKHVSVYRPASEVRG